MTLKLDLRPHASRIATRHARRPPSDAYTPTGGAIVHDVIHIKDFGAVGDGVTDDTSALVAWVAAINASTDTNVTAMLGSGTYPLASALVANGLVITRDKVHIEGNGGAIKVTGTSVVKSVFNSDGRSWLTYRNVRFLGNSQANAFANGAAIWFTTYTGGNATGLLVENCYFENFKADYWVFCENYQTRAMSHINIRDNIAVSMAGNARGPATITIASSFCGVFGSGDPGYLCSEVLIEDNVVYADYIKSGAVVQNQVQNFTIQNNTVWNAGQQGISNDVGAYGIQIYANVPFTPGKYGRTTGNKILFPRSIGIYQANTFPGSIIANNLIESQGPDTLNVTLTKGGICLNGAYECSVTGNIIVNTARDAIWCNTSPQLHTGLNISNNTIRGADRGVVFESATYDGRDVVIQNNLIRDIGTVGITCRSYTGVSTSDITIRNNQIQLLANASIGIVFDSPTSTFQLFYCLVQANTIRANASSCKGITFNGFTASSSLIRDNTLFGTFAAGVETTGSTGVTAATNTTIA